MPLAQGQVSSQKQHPPAWHSCWTATPSSVRCDFRRAISRYLQCHCSPAQAAHIHLHAAACAVDFDLWGAWGGGRGVPPPMGLMYQLEKLLHDFARTKCSASVPAHGCSWEHPRRPSKLIQAWTVHAGDGQRSAALNHNIRLRSAVQSSLP